MSAESIEKRLSDLEAEVARLSAKVDGEEKEELPWWRKIAGAFENDPHYAEAMRLGREYRESLRPKPKKNKKAEKKNKSKSK